MKRYSFPHAIPSVLAAALTLAACATPSRVDSEATPSADFSARHTYAWQESKASYDPPPRTLDVQSVKQTIHDAVLQQLQQKGYSESSKPDFLVSFHLVVTETEVPELCVRRQMIFEWPDSVSRMDDYEVCRRDPVMVNSRTVRNGTLVVFVVDATTRNLLWQGVADGADGTHRSQLEKLRDAVERMFASFPAESV